MKLDLNQSENDIKEYMSKLDVKENYIKKLEKSNKGNNAYC